MLPSRGCKACRLAAIVAVMGFGAIGSLAEAATWLGAAQSAGLYRWENTLNWDSPIPGLWDTAEFNSPTNQLVTIYSSSGTSIQRLNFRGVGTGTGTGSVAFQSTTAIHALTVGAGGITLDSGAGAVTFGGNVADAKTGVFVRLSSDQTWTNNSASLLSTDRNSAITNTASSGITVTLTLAGNGGGGATLNGKISDNGPNGKTSLVINNTSATGGVTTLSGANTYTGSTTVIAGTLALGYNGVVNGSLGDTAVTVSGGSFATALAADGSVSVGSPTSNGGQLSMGSGTTLNLVDGHVTTLNVNGTGSLADAGLNFELGININNDALAITGAATLSGENTVTVSAIGSSLGWGAETTHTYTLVTAAGGGLNTGGTFALASDTLTVGSQPYTLALTNSAGAEQLVVTAITPEPAAMALAGISLFSLARRRRSQA
jgi:hypothetical protein